MYTLFISDLHLASHLDKTINIFIRFINQQSYIADAIYILGDLFETWIGDDIDNEFIQMIYQSLHQASQRIPIYFMHGNRDFLIGQKFARLSGCQLLDDPCVINLYGEPTILTHGDILCTDDISYQRWRRIAHTSFIQKLFLCLPLSIRQMLARQARYKSHQRGQHTSSTTMDATKQAIELIFKKYRAKQLIHGHTHQPAIHYLLNKGDRLTRFVLSDWHYRGSVLICKPDQRFRLIDLW